MSVKSIAKAIKEGALKRVRWYCQVCEKQCRDQNGYDMHMRSEGHTNRVMQLGDTGRKQMTDECTEKFTEAFLQLVRARYQVRVLANRVYNEYVQDRHHIHMNATRFKTLTTFVEHLGSTGVCKVEEEPDGLYITYQSANDRKNTKAFLSRKKEQKRERSDAEESARETIQLNHLAKKQATGAASALPIPPLTPAFNPLLPLPAQPLFTSPLSTPTTHPHPSESSLPSIPPLSNPVLYSSPHPLPSSLESTPLSSSTLPALSIPALSIPALISPTPISVQPALPSISPGMNLPSNPPASSLITSIFLDDE